MRPLKPLICEPGDFASGLAGAIYGAFASFIITTALVELSFNRAFSIAFGVGFMGFGVVVFARAIQHAALPTSTSKSRCLLYCFAAMIVSSGAFCFCVDTAITSEFSVTTKIPMYSFLGVVLTFALTFAFVDIFNAFAGATGHPSINQTAQVLVLMAASFVVGVVFGFFFGSLDVEDDDVRHRRLSEERHVCTPIAVAVSTFTGMAVRRLSEPHYAKRKGSDDGRGEEAYREREERRGKLFAI